MAPDERSYINDQWTLELEDLGFDREAEGLARMVLMCEPPFAACIAGRWGSGKTSVMRYAMTLLGGDTASARLPYQSHEVRDQSYGGHERLTQVRDEGATMLAGHGYIALTPDSDQNPLAKPLDRVATLWFSPWRFQGESNPMVPLLRSLRDQLSNWAKSKHWLSTRARKLFEAGLEIIGHLADSALAFSGHGTSFGELGKTMRSAFAQAKIDNFETMSDTERFHLLFERAIQSVLGVLDSDDKGKTLGDPGNTARDRHRLVIFIDDLDRCEGEASLRLLEAIKLYLSTRYCVFVLGLDVPAVESALRAQWPTRPPGMAREYLDKLFQSYVHMPRSSHYARFIHNQLRAWSHIPDTRIATSAPGRESTTAAPHDTAAHDTAPHDTATMLAAILPANPRKVKNFLNSLHLAWSVAKTRDATFVAALDLYDFALVQRLRILAPRVFTLVAEDPAGHLRELARFLEMVSTRQAFRLDPVHQVLGATMVRAFRHVTVLDEDSAADPMVPTLTLEHVDVHFESVAGDRAFAERWSDAAMDVARFRRHANLNLARSAAAPAAAAAAAPAALAAASAPAAGPMASHPGDA